MQQLIITTFLIIIAFSFFNLIASIVLYFSSRQKLYIPIIFFWGTLIINFLLQMFFQSSEDLIILVYGYAVIPLNILVFVSLRFIEKKYPLKRFITLTIACFILTFILFQTDQSFTIKALPMAFATGIPLLFGFCSIMIKYNKQSGMLMKAHSLVLFAQGIHCLNFALFRMEENAQLWGWPVSYALYQLIATTLPAITLSFFHTQEKERLEALVKSRTEKIEIAIEEKEHVFKILSHDISNPLSILKLNLGLFERKLKTPDEIALTAQKVVNRMTDIIEQARVLNQVEHNINELPLTPIVLNSSLREMESLFCDSLHKKSISLELNLQTSDTDCFLGDKSSFENSILSNFISNAIKFSSEKSKISIATIKDKSNIYIEITDSGIGIPEEVLMKIFNFDISSSRKGTQNESGNGLGVSIAKKYVDFFKGTIQLESKTQTESNESYTKIKLSFPLIS